MIRRLFVCLLALLVFTATSNADTIYYKPITSADSPTITGNLTVNGTNGGNAGIFLNSAVPFPTSSTLYNDSGTLYWNGSAIGFGYTPENVSNKALNFSTVNDTLYPSVKAVKDYTDSLVWGLLDDRGNFDASGNVFPSTGGSGDSGAILKGDIWKISVAGTLGGVPVAVNDSVRALTDIPGQTAANWGIISGEIVAGTGLTKTGQILSANLSTGIAGGQSAIGGTEASENLTFSSTVNATKGKILFGTSAYDEVNNYLGVGTNAPSSALDVHGIATFRPTAAISTLRTNNSNARLDFITDRSAGTSLSFNFRNNAGTTLLGILASGNIGFGTSSPIAPFHQVSVPSTVSFTDSIGNTVYPTHLLQVNQTTNPTGNDQGFSVDYTFNPSTYSGSKTINAQRSILTIPATNAQNFGGLSPATLQGFGTQANFLGTGTLANLVGNRVSTATGLAGAGTISGVFGNYMTLTLNGQAGRVLTSVNGNYVDGTNTNNNIDSYYGTRNLFSNNSGTITNWHGNHTSIGSNLGTITNTYGYYVGDITSGTQTNTPYSFYASDGNSYNYFAGNTGIGTSTPSSKLSVISANDSNTTPIISAYSNNLTQGIVLRFDGIFADGTNSAINTGLYSKNGNVFLNGSAIKASATEFYANTLRLNGGDTGNTIWESTASSNLAITTNGGDISLGGATSQKHLTVKGTTGLVGILNNTPSANLDANPTTITTASFTRPRPSVTTIQQNGLTNLVEAAEVWNNEQKTIRIYNGTELDAQKAPTTKYIYSIADLPAPVAGQRTLTSNTHYIFSLSAPITTTDEIIFGDGVVVEFAYITASKFTALGTFNAKRSNMITTGATLFNYSGTVANKVLRLTETNLVAATTTQFFNMTSTQPYVFIIEQVALIGSAGSSLGIIANCKHSSNRVDLGQLGAVSSGIVFNNNYGLTIENIDISNGGSFVSPAALFTFGGTTQGSIQLEKILLNNSGANVYAYKFDTATTFSYDISNHNGSITDKTKPFAASSYTQATPGFKFSAVGNIQSSTVNSSMEFSNGTPPATVVPAQNVYVSINQTGYTSNFSERITNETTTGLTTFTGIEDRTVVANAIVVMDDAGTNKLLTARFAKMEALSRTVTFTNGTDRVNLANHGLSNGQQVKFTNSGGALPTNLRPDILYYVVNATTSDFQVSLTSGGAAVDFTTDGTGTTTARISYMVGGAYPIRVSSGSAIASTPYALIPLKIGDSIWVMVRNETDGNNINVYSVYKTIKE